MSHSFRDFACAFLLDQSRHLSFVRFVLDYPRFKSCEIVLSFFFIKLFCILYYYVYLKKIVILSKNKACLEFKTYDFFLILNKLSTFKKKVSVIVLKIINQFFLKL